MSVNPATALARVLVDELARGGVTDAVLAPGSRSAPLAMALAADARIRCRVMIDERSAVFCAVGLGKVTRRPAVVLSTSGTAAVNFHPGVVEASHARVPLVVLTADRPPEQRDTAANQTVDQLGLYGSAVRWFCEVGVPEARPGAVGYWRSIAARALAEASGSPPGPVHANVAFREPLVPGGRDRGSSSSGVGEGAGGWSGVGEGAGGWSGVGEGAGGWSGVGEGAGGWSGVGEGAGGSSGVGEGAGGCPDVGEDAGASLGGRPEGRPWTTTTRGPRPAPPEAVERLAGRVSGTERGLVLAGDGDADPHAVVRLAERRGWPLIAEPTSNARFGAHAISTAHALASAEAFAAAHRPELVVQFGKPGLSRAVAGLVEGAADHVLVDADGAWLDPQRGVTEVLAADPAAVADQLGEVAAAGGASDWWASWHDADRRARRVVDGILDGEHATTEPRTARDLAEALPDGALLLAASSMPIRDLDAFMRPRTGLRLLGNRGASGIDGFVSTALGAAATHDGPTVALAGDLSLLHDQNGLLLADRPDLVVVVVHNDGGGIFSLLPQAGFPEHFETVFGTPHGVDLAQLAATHRCGHTHVGRAAELPAAVREAGAAGGVQLVEVRTDRAANAALHQRLLDAVAGELAR